MSGQGIDLDRSTLGNWVGRAAFELHPVFDGLLADPKRQQSSSSTRLVRRCLIPVLAKPRRDTSGHWLVMTARGAEVGLRASLHLCAQSQAERISQGSAGIL